MKTYLIKSLFILFGTLTSLNLFAQCQVNLISPTGSAGMVCPTSQSYTFQAVGWSGSFESWSVEPSSAATAVITDPLDLSKAHVTFSNTFSGCSLNALVKFRYHNNRGSFFCEKAVVIHKDIGPITISGPNFVAPANGTINSLPTVTYSVANSNCGTFIWETPDGWDILSGQGTNTIQVSPSITSACSGLVKVNWSNGLCERSQNLNVTRAPLSNGTLNSFCQSVDSWTTLNICEDDEIIIDASTSTFCNTNNNIFISLTEFDQNWVNSQEFTQWLTPAQYALFGGIAKLNARNVYATFFNRQFTSSNQFGSGNYKIKIAVSGSSTWNERTYTLVINPPSVPAPINTTKTILPLTPGAPIQQAKLIWFGNPNKRYTVVYEYSDDPGFAPAYTTTNCANCFFPNAEQNGFVSTIVGGIPQCYYFRYRVRECDCGIWYGSPNNIWTTIGQLCKKGSTGFSDVNINKSDIRVYPNPASNLATIAFEQAPKAGFQLEVVDITGKVVLSKHYHASQELNHPIDITNWNNGLYLIKIMVDGDDTIYMNKLTKE